MALRAIAASRQRRTVPANPCRVGLFVINAIGDTVLISAIAADIKRCLPSTHITLIATQSNIGVASLIQDVDECLVLPLMRPHIAVPVLRRAAIDLIIDFTQWARITAIYTAVSGACGIGFRTAGQSRHFAYDQAIRHSAVRHELDNYRALLMPLGIAAKCSPRLAIPPNTIKSAQQKVNSDRYILFHPWAGGSNGWRREWPTEHWVSLASKVASLGFDIIVTGAPCDAPAATCLVEACAQDRVAIWHIAGQLSLPETAALIANASAIVSVNTGIMHLAACLDIPMVALHGPTDPARWGPLSDRAAIVVPNGGRHAFLNLGFEYPPEADDCMVLIDVDTVFRSLIGLIGDVAAQQTRQSPSRTESTASG